MALTGNEVLQVQGIAANGMPAATTETTTTGAIAALASAAFGSDVVTSISTVGNGTLTAAALVGGVINRTGPVAAFTDTTATAALIYAQAGSVTGSFYTMIRNTTAFVQTLSAGVGVTLPANVIIPANSVGTYLVTIASAVATTFTQIETVPITSETLEVVTALSTVGAGTITAAGIAGKITARSGPVAAFTDTTATADLIIAAVPNASIGTSWEYIYYNTTAFTATIAGGAGVTPSRYTLIPANSWVRYLVTYTAASTITMVGIEIGSNIVDVPEVITTLSTVGAGTITAAGIAGGVTSRTGSQSATPFTDTTDTATAIIAAKPNAAISQSWEYTYQNTTNAVATLTGGAGVTVSGITAVNAGYTARYLVTYTAASTITMVGFSSGQSLASTQQTATFAGSTSGTTILKASATAGSTTQTLPAVSGVVASTSGTNLFIADITKCTAPVTKNANITYANVTGLSQTVVPGTYAFVCKLPSTVASGTGGIKYAFNYTTTVLTSIEATGRGMTASAIAVQHTTTTTTQTDLFTQAAVVIYTEITGSMVVSTGGTIDLQMAQNTSNASDTVALLGGTMEFVRIA